MAVLLPNTRLGVRRRAEHDTRDAHGGRILAGWTTMTGPLPGRTEERPDGGFDLALDPTLWPLRQGDLVIGDGGWSWLVDRADLLRNNYDPSVDYINASGMQRSAGGTEPGGGWFVGRHTPTVQRVAVHEDGPTSPVQTDSHLWTGYGPPPEPDADLFPVEDGDEYVDLHTGEVYRYGEEPT